MKCCEPLRISSLKFLLLLLLASALWGDIILRDLAIKKPNLKLGDIAKIVDKNPNRANYLASLHIDEEFMADGIVSQNEIKKILQKNFIDTSKIKIMGSTVKLQVKAKKIDKETILQTIERFVHNRYKNIAIDKISLRFHTLPLRSGTYRIRIEPTSESFHHIYLQISIYDGVKLAKKLKVTLYVQRFIDAAVAAKSIRKGEIIDAQDIQSKKVRLANSSQLYLTPAQVIGAVAKRDIKPNQTIKRYMIEPDYDVKKKRSVKIIYQKGPIRIELLGLALQNGKVGDIIRVKNLSSNKVLRCKVISSGAVQYLY